MTLLTVAGLQLKAGARTLVDDVGFDVEAGEIVALVGESGSGKTMAARTVMGLLPPGIARTAGSITFAGQDLAGATPKQLRRLRGPGIGMVFQEPMVSLNPALTIGAQMAEGLALHTGASAREIGAQCRAMLARIGIDDPERCLKAHPHQFSGGMRQRIMLASVMLLRPKLLIADEPTTALDTLTQRDVLDLMVELTREAGTAVLLITHNLGLVANYARRAVVMRQGQVVEQGRAADILNRPRQAYTRALIDALPRRGPASVQRFAVPLISARNLSVAHAGAASLFRRRPAHLAVDGVSLTVHDGEIVAVVGGSGSGKTTLGRAMLRLLPASGGALLFAGQDITAARGEALRPFRAASQMVFQDPHSSLDPRYDIGRIVGEPLQRLPAGERVRAVARILDEVGLGGYERRLPHELSGGQRQRVAIARAVVARPRFVVADEPVSALDMTIQQQILTLFKTLQARHGFACLFISHDLAAVEQIADRVVVMEKGRIVEAGSRDDVFDRPQADYTRRLLAATPLLAPAA